MQKERKGDSVASRSLMPYRCGYKLVDNYTCPDRYVRRARAGETTSTRHANESIGLNKEYRIAY